MVIRWLKVIFSLILLALAVSATAQTVTFPGSVNSIPVQQGGTGSNRWFILPDTLMPEITSTLIRHYGLLAWRKSDSSLMAFDGVNWKAIADSADMPSDYVRRYSNVDVDTFPQSGFIYMADRIYSNTGVGTAIEDGSGNFVNQGSKIEPTQVTVTDNNGADRLILSGMPAEIIGNRTGLYSGTIQWDTLDYDVVWETPLKGGRLLTDSVLVDSINNISLQDVCLVDSVTSTQITTSQHTITAKNDTISSSTIDDGGIILESSSSEQQMPFRIRTNVRRASGSPWFVDDVRMFIGYNISETGGRENTDMAQLRLDYEQKFYNAGSYNDTSSEWHLNFTNKAGQVRRAIGFYGQQNKSFTDNFASDLQFVTTNGSITHPSTGIIAGWSSLGFQLNTLPASTASSIYFLTRDNDGANNGVVTRISAIPWGYLTSVPTASSSVSGILSSTDWTTFNSKIGGSGTINTIPKFASSGTVGNSNVTDNGTTVNIGSRFAITAGSVASGATASSLTATMSATNATQILVDQTITAAGSNANAKVGWQYTLAAGATGGYVRNSQFVNLNTGNPSGTITTAHNEGLWGIASGTTTGTNIGIRQQADNGSINVGNWSYSTTAKNGAVNVGIFAQALNTGTTPVNCAGYFSLSASSTEPTFVSAALIANNGATTDHIFRLQDNGTDVITVADGGAFVSTNTITGTMMRIAYTQTNAGTLSPAVNTNYYFNGTTSTWTLPAVAANANNVIMVRNAGTGTITVNSSAGGNDIVITTESAAANTVPILSGEQKLFRNQGNTYWVIE